ncbi:ABC transporter permease [Heyndrickxia coagulans]|uniref:ABC3 transporter permease C-terminal domain-containing protein n=1 Tax=Heyndrickxia coagulans TaxID=1398 RepID=A0A150JYI2_HEYCO|nr:ABC transporter permease [Heyndrickxia coagulans]KYC62350.1 hypothetical protein B4099_1607 [Heyndrickxia coagulans]
MFNLSIKVLLSRKKWLFLIAGSIAIVLSSVASIFTASASVRSAIKQKAQNTYGEHTGVLTNISETKTSLLNKNKEITAGVYQIIGKTKVSNDIFATVGWMDKKSIRLGHLRLINGKFPDKPNEVAIESAYLQGSLKNWKISENKSIKIGNKIKKMRLVGIVKNYSSQWSVAEGFEKGVNDFPNIFISKQLAIEYKKNNSFLFKYNESTKDSFEKSLNLIDYYDQQGTVNSRLFNNGLNRCDTIKFLSNIFQLLIVILSLFSINSLILHFTRDQHKKMGIMRSVGASQRALYRMYIYQAVIIFVLSALISIPIVFFIQSLIIHFSYRENSTNFKLIIEMIGISALLYVVLFFMILVLFLKNVKKTGSLHIKELLSQQNSVNFNERYKRVLKYFQSIHVKLLVKELFSNPKQFCLTIFILSFSSLIFTFTNYIQKDNLYGWEGLKSKYYLTSQEAFSSKSKQNLTVLSHQGLTFTETDVKKLEKTPGVLYIDKTPFMDDVETLMDQRMITPSINSWIFKENSAYKTYHNKIIIPDVNYVLLNEDDWNNIETPKKYKNPGGKVLIFNPINNKRKNEDKALAGNTLTLVRLYKMPSGMKISQKNLTILDVIHKPFKYRASRSVGIKKDGFIIVMDTKTAVKSGLFHGFSDLEIYTKKDISHKDKINLDKQVKLLSATFPGSLVQNISQLIKDDSKIYNYLKVLGNLLFFVSLILTAISVTIMIFSKYQTQKRHWGIYLSLGMSKNNIMQYVFSEIFIYVLVSMMLSMTICCIGLFMLPHQYPLVFYFKYFLLSILIEVSFLIIGGYIIHSSLQRQSIAAFLRRDE